MGQYFKFVNVDKQEVVQQPSGTKLPEIMWSGLSGQVMMYLLFDGPFDGTTDLPGLYADGDELAERLTDEFLATEHRREDENDDYESIYRDDDGSWDRDKARRVGLANSYTGEDAICGRWAGDDVRIIGDYADDSYYHAPYGTVVVERPPYGEFEYYGDHPSPVGRRYDINAKPGDSIETYSLDGDGSEEVIFVEHIEDNGWDDITDSVFAEMARYMPGQFGQLDDGDLEPEIVFGSGSNPDYS